MEPHPGNRHGDVSIPGAGRRGHLNFVSARLSDGALEATTLPPSYELAFIMKL